MPHIDARSGEVVIRIIYDGAPEAGKTTNVLQLANQISLQRRGAVMSPGTEGERTEFFDWLDFSGGYLDGRRVRCQLVSVPGQTALAHRRNQLLGTADAIVFVVDSRAEKLDEATASLLTTVRVIEEVGKGVPVGVVVQVNKQHQSDALPAAEILKRLGMADNTPTVSSVASNGHGVMETFVLAARLATDRVRTLLLQNNVLADLPASDVGPAELHSAMVALEEAERRVHEGAALKAREAAESKAREEAEHKAREEAERKAREEAEHKAREEAEHKAREEAERKAREEAERKAREEAERKAREESERKAREESERKAREESERKAREESERKAREESERKAREESERKAREESARKAREESERKARQEAERKAREEAERKAREESERKARQESERKIRKAAESKANEEKDALEELAEDWPMASEPPGVPAELHEIVVESERSRGPARNDSPPPVPRKSKPEPPAVQVSAGSASPTQKSDGGLKARPEDRPSPPATPAPAEVPESGIPTRPAPALASVTESVDAHRVEDAKANAPAEASADETPADATEAHSTRPSEPAKEASATSPEEPARALAEAPRGFWAFLRWLYAWLFGG